MGNPVLCVLSIPLPSSFYLGRRSPPVSTGLRPPTVSPKDLKEGVTVTQSKIHLFPTTLSHLGPPPRVHRTRSDGRRAVTVRTEIPHTPPTVGSREENQETKAGKGDVTGARRTTTVVSREEGPSPDPGSLRRCLLDAPGPRVPWTFP